VKPDTRLCAHLAALAPAQLPIDPADILDWYDGPISAVVRCTRCGGAGILELIDCDQAAGTRGFTLAGLEPEAFAVYRRNVDRGSCDPARLARETAALYACAGPVERLVTLRASDGAVLQAGPAPAGFHLPDATREQRLSARDGWSVWREDDDGNRFEVSRGLSLADTGQQAGQCEARGHEQRYWLAPTRRASHSPPPTR